MIKNGKGGIFFALLLILVSVIVFIVSCERDENLGIPPRLDEWWKQIEEGGEIFGDFRYKTVDGKIKIIRYEGEGGTVIIPAEIEGVPITSIGIYAFRETNLTDIIIPDSVTFIEQAAFQRNLLNNVVIPDGVTSIESCVFSHNKLTYVVIPNSITSIGLAAFQKNMLTNVIIPDGVTYIEDGVFAYNRLTDIVIPDGVTYIGQHAFPGNLLTSVVIPNSVTSIQANAFTGNPLVEITIGANTQLEMVSIDTYSYFNKAYIANNRQAGTYIKPDTNSPVWTKQ